MGKWETVRLGNLGLFQTGGTPTRNRPDYFEGTIPWITTPALGNTYIDASSANAFLSEDAISRSATKIIPANSLMVGIRVGVGKTSINTVPMCTNQDIVSISGIDSSKTSLEYLHKYVITQQGYLNAQKRGATIQGIRTELLKEISIPLPPLDVQRKIADVLDRASDLIEKRKAQIDKLDLLIKSQFIEMFGDPVTNPKGWKIQKIKDVCEAGKHAIKAGPFGSSLKKEFYVESGYKIYGQEQVINGDPDFGDYYISEKKFKELNSCAVKTGDILISLVGTYGKLLIIPPNHQKGIINPRLMKISLNQKMIVPVYFKYYFTSQAVVFTVKEISRGGTMDILNTGLVRELNIPIPALALQIQFTDFVQKVEAQKGQLQQSLAKLEQNYKSLMQKCFKGEVF